MKQIVPATLLAAAYVFTPQILSAQDADSAAAENSAATEERLERQARQVESIREIDSLAVISLRQPSEASAGEGEGEDDLTSVSEEDLLLSGIGTRQMLTAEDTDELPPGMVEDDAVADAMAADEEMDDPAIEADENAPEIDLSTLHDAIEGNEVLAGALADRNVDIASVVGVEIRDGTTVIVYIDES